MTDGPRGWKILVATDGSKSAERAVAAATTRKANASPVAVGSRGVTGLERILLGSVTERLLAAPGISLFIGR